MHALAQLKEYIQRKLKRPTTFDITEPVQITGVGGDAPVSISTVGGRVEVTSDVRWDLNGSGTTIKRVIKFVW